MRKTIIDIDVHFETGKPTFSVSVRTADKRVDRMFRPVRSAAEARALALDLYDLLEDLELSPAIQPSESLGPEDVARPDR